MGTSADVADQIVNIGLNSFEKTINITGKGAERVLALLLATLKDNRNSRGKQKLKNMLKSNKELDIFTIKQTDLKVFTKKAKEYGLPFAALCSKTIKSTDGVVDLLVRVEDAPKVNRIVERFKLIIQEEGEVKLESEKGLKHSSNQLLQSEKKTLSNNSLLTNSMNDNTMNMKNMISLNKEKKSVKGELNMIKEEQKMKLENINILGREKNETR